MLPLAKQIISSSNTSHLHLICSLFESQPGHQLLKLFVIFLIPSRLTLWYNLERVHNCCIPSFISPSLFHFVQYQIISAAHIASLSNLLPSFNYNSNNSLVVKVTGWTAEVRFSSSWPCPYGLWAHPASHPMGTGSLFVQ
jgi:hypothetical protein